MRKTDPSRNENDRPNKLLTALAGLGLEVTRTCSKKSKEVVAVFM